MFSGEIPNKELPDLKFVWMSESNLQALVIQKVDNPIHWINLNPVDSVVGIHNTYPLDNDLSGLLRYKTFEQPGPGPGCIKPTLKCPLKWVTYESVMGTLTGVAWNTLSTLVSSYFTW